jgi:hypothetical protein
MTGFINDWDLELMAEVHPIWASRGLIAGALIDVDDLVTAIDAVLRSGATVATPSITLTPRPVAQI